MKKSMTIAALATALVLSAGCAKKKPADLPPPPGGTETGVGAEGAGTGAGAGRHGRRRSLAGLARADFLQNVTADRVYFATDSHTLDPEARAVLDTQAAWLTRNAGARVTIEGHADERGTREYNLALGDRRANAAKNYLSGRGIAESRMTVISWGKERPEADGSDESAWAKNRRAVTVLPQ